MKKKKIVNEITHCNMEAEQTLLGAIIIDETVFNTIVKILPKAEYFGFVEHQQIYQHFLDMLALGEHIDFVTACSGLVKANVYEAAEAKEYLFSLATMVSSLSNVAEYAKIVKKQYIFRKLAEFSAQISQNVIESSSEPEEILAAAEQMLLDLRLNDIKSGLEKIGDSVDSVLAKIDDIATNGAKNDGILTGFDELDQTIFGLHPGDLVMIAARPGMGKTAFALNIAEHVASVDGQNVAFFSLEMTTEQLINRLICATAEISNGKLQNGNLTDCDWQNLASAQEHLQNINLFVDDTSGITVPEMAAKIRGIPGIRLVVIDYLQLLSGVKKHENRVQEVSELTRSLKIMAKDVGVPVILLSQLSRASEQRNDHKPLLSDLRDSGSIEQDADLVLFLYRKNYYDDKLANSGDAECIIAKNRHGKTGTIPLTWSGRYFKFSNVVSANVKMTTEPFVVDGDPFSEDE